NARPLADAVVVARIVARQRPVERAVLADVRRPGRPRTDYRSVEAADRLQRAVPELHQPLAVLVGDALTEIDRGLAVRLAVDPVVGTAERRGCGAADRGASARGRELAGEAARGDEEGDGDREGAADAATPDAKKVGQR